MAMTSNDEYTARLARVSANRGRSVIMVGADESFVFDPQKLVLMSRQREIAGNLAQPAAFVGAFALGMGAVVLGHIARFHAMSGEPKLNDADMEMAVSAAIGLFLAFALSHLLRLASSQHLALQGIGVLLMVCSFHNLFFWAPAAMSAAFSPEYQSRIIVTAKPNSFQLRGEYIPFFERSTMAPVSAEETATETPAAEAATCAPVGPEIGRITVTGERRKEVEIAPVGPSCP
jgi:hypothetical protein